MKSNFNGTMLTGVALAGAAILMGACGSNGGGIESYWGWHSFLGDGVVSVFFDAKGCPESVDPEKFEIERRKVVVWQAVDAGGNPIKMEYSIYFDPFRGRDLSSDGEGRTPRRGFSQAAIDLAGMVEYKYSIVSKATCEPLDPRFRLR